MICVTIGRSIHRGMIADHKKLAESGAKLVELRVDHIRSAVNVGRLLDDRPCPVIFTCRRKVDGGEWEGTEEERIMLLRSAVVAGVDYVDIEADVASKIPRYGNTKRIISYHNFKETPENLNQVYLQMLKLDPDVIKIATMANHPSDMLKVLKLCLSKKSKTIAFCMGEKGIPSRILCRKFGSPWSYASMESKRRLAPGQLSVREMVNRYRFNSINRETRIYGMIGDPVDVKFNPQMQNANLQKEEINAVYLPFRVEGEDLNEFIEISPLLEVRGLSVGLPHKEGVLKAVKALDDDVYGVRACNTLVFRKDKTYGYNTDCRAGLISLARAIGRSEDERSPFDGSIALILGSGSVAKAMAYGLLRGGAQVLVASRNEQTANDLAAHLKCFTFPWERRHEATFDFLINCTPIGMDPNRHISPFNHKCLRDEMVVFDSVYDPEQTMLLRQAHEVGCTVVTGIDMFVRQAALQFEMFTGREADIGLMREVMKREIVSEIK